MKPKQYLLYRINKSLDFVSKSPQVAFILHALNRDSLWYEHLVYYLNAAHRIELIIIYALSFHTNPEQLLNTVFQTWPKYLREYWLCQS